MDLAGVQETNPTAGSLEIISVAEDEPPVPQIQFTFKRFFFIPQARVDPSADESGDIEPPSMCHALVSLKYFPYICGLFLAVTLAAAIGLGELASYQGMLVVKSLGETGKAKTNGISKSPLQRNNLSELTESFLVLNLKVRLSGKRAVLQVFTFGSWRTVCSDDWRAEYGNTTCKHLGFSSYVSSGYLPVAAVEKQFQRHFVSLSHWFSADQVTSLHNATNLSLYLPSSWSVQVGFVTQQDTQVHPHSVEKIIYHRNYKPKTMGNDIALMKLAAPLALNGDTSDTMNYAGVPLISNAICNHRDVYGGIITSSMLCAGFLKGGVDTCQGDSGGPLACEDMSIWKLVGTTSFGVGCAEKNKPGVYSRTTSFLDWIHEQMEEGHGTLGANPEKGHTVDERTGAPPQRQAEKVMPVQPEEEKVVWRPQSSFQSLKGLQERWRRTLSGTQLARAITYFTKQPFAQRIDLSGLFLVEGSEARGSWLFQWQHFRCGPDMDRGTKEKLTPGTQQGLGTR
ncbi:hypothetical protein DUI87_15620 [Hirundo rustica rustica]|uniref:Transmembrane protease serine 3 n=1 Tax=Hirundo rustica rustica TaxID=333673 RepID=A0A3M0K539_HIRRU|nr:hypothetical protein DUI87_15620 [Hirundo rustica rustica]